MAHCPRSAKSANNWTDYELYGLNIRVVNVDAATFFDLDGPELPPSTASEVILNNTNRPGGPLTKDDRQFFQYMDLLQPGAPWPRVADFSAFIARMMNYDDKNCLIFQRVDVPFPMVGKFVYSKLDVCLMDVHNRKLLLHIHENKSATCDPNPTVIAKAISIFYQNYPVKQTAESIPAISMTGTAPAFYRIPVTPPLLQALKGGYYPEAETVVLRFVPRVPIQERYLDGMLSLENRRIILQSLEAFKAVITGK